mmetsp:Transcript_8777/g.17847  ORF Transcript_8777/g.17847 Transcript_8777/m.17847 type:complete len:240 (+) Transcript_8777:490-1209(+)
MPPSSCAIDPSPSASAAAASCRRCGLARRGPWSFASRRAVGCLPLRIRSSRKSAGCRGRSLSSPQPASQWTCSSRWSSSLLGRPRCTRASRGRSCCRTRAICPRCGSSTRPRSPPTSPSRRARATCSPTRTLTSRSPSTRSRSTAIFGTNASRSLSTGSRPSPSRSQACASRLRRRARPSPLGQRCARRPPSPSRSRTRRRGLGASTPSCRTSSGRALRRWRCPPASLPTTWSLTARWR